MALLLERVNNPNCDPKSSSPRTPLVWVGVSRSFRGRLLNPAEWIDLLKVKKDHANYFNRVFFRFNWPISARNKNPQTKASADFLLAEFLKELVDFDTQYCEL